MPNNLPSSFASAAAGQNLNRDAGGDWARRDGRPNNATLTFRRQPLLPTQAPAFADAIQMPAADSSFPPNSSTMTDPIADFPAGGGGAITKYSKAQLLTIYCQLRDDPMARKNDLARLYMPGWSPGSTNGSSGRGGDGKGSEPAVSQKPYWCWDSSGTIHPMGLVELTTEEKELFSDIDSTVKPPPNKDGNHLVGGVNGLKMSHGGGSGGLTSPVSRSSTRRHQTDLNLFGGGGAPTPPTTIGRSRDQLPPKFGRRVNESREAVETTEQPEDDAGPSSPLLNRGPFGGLTRSNTAGNAAGLGSMWSQPSLSAATVGSFGNFALPSSTISDNRFGSSQSRLAHLIPKETPETVKAQEAVNNEASRPWISRPNEVGSGPGRPWRARPRTDTDPFGDMDEGTKSSPARGTGSSDTDFSGFRMNEHADDVPLSPSGTNPYRSPPTDTGEKGDRQPAEKTDGSTQVLGVIGRGPGANACEESDRSQTSSTGPKSYASNPAGGWPPSAGTPDRDRLAYNGAFGASVFSPIGDVPSPALGHLGGGVFVPGANSVGRGGKLGSLFPPAMRAQMQQVQQMQGRGQNPHDSLADSLADIRHVNPLGLIDSLPDIGHVNPLGAIGKNTLGLSPRDVDSPARQTRGFGDYLHQSERTNPIYTTMEPSISTTTVATPPFATPQPSDQPPSSSQVPTLVMPDRMFWVYQDPSGRVQGPFTGLDMHEWFKGKFFSPDLRVKRVEDTEFEPLGQLIRRIGNGREPFLVPQNGIPHGPPVPSGQISATSGSIIPPLSGVLPTYGPTLTAEQQNNLEQHKQEEQMLFARQQREFTMRQQMSKFGVPGGQMLQHHSSAHSLQSQPSFGSVASPIVMPLIGPGHVPVLMGSSQLQGFLEQSAVAQALPLHEKMRDEWATTEQRMMGSATESTDAVGMMASQMTAKASSRPQLPQTEQLADDEEGFKARLQEFEQLRSHREPGQATITGSENFGKMPSAGEAQESTESLKMRMAAREAEALSFTGQVQKAKAAAATTERSIPLSFAVDADAAVIAAPTAQPARSHLPEQYMQDMPRSPELMSPTSMQLSAPAPWARELPTESQRGPGLKEIQEAEARKVAKEAKETEGLAALQRKRQDWQEEEATPRDREKVATIVATGLATSSTWGKGSSGPVQGPWTKPGAASKGSVGTASPIVSLSAAAAADKKQTLADIQREQEMGKQKAKDVVPAGVAKSYAALAGKAGAVTPVALQQFHQTAAMKPMGDAAHEWSTVGAGGKVKPPAGPGGQQQQQQQGQFQSQAQDRPASNTMAAAKPTLTKTTPRSALPPKDNVSEAITELMRWVRKQLSGPGGITEADIVDNVVKALDPYSSDVYLIEDITAPTKLDGPWIIEEYNRRKKLALKGIIVGEDAKGQSGGASGSGRDDGTVGGWNEVAKRGDKTAREDDGPGFKVVAKGKKNRKHSAKA